MKWTRKTDGNTSKVVSAHTRVYMTSSSFLVLVSHHFYQSAGNEIQCHICMSLVLKNLELAFITLD